MATAPAAKAPAGAFSLAEIHGFLSMLEFRLRNELRGIRDPEQRRDHIDLIARVAFQLDQIKQQPDYRL